MCHDNCVAWPEYSLCQKCADITQYGKRAAIQYGGNGTSHDQCILFLQESVSSNLLAGSSM